MNKHIDDGCEIVVPAQKLKLVDDKHCRLETGEKVLHQAGADGELH